MLESNNMESQPEAQPPSKADICDAEFHILEKRLEASERICDLKFRQIVRPDEYALITPFLRNWPEDRKLGDAMLNALAAHERELGWFKHYFIEPLLVVEERTNSKTTNYMFNKIVKDLSACLDKANKSAHYTLAQIEGLLQALAQRADLCRRVAPVINKPNEPLVRAFAGVDITDAFRLYAIEIKDRAKAYLTLPPEGKAILSWRLMAFGEDLEKADNAFSEKLQTLSGEYKKAYETIRMHEQTSKHFPVNLQWFAALPKDISSFISTY